jgi:hypothetical protein
MYCSFSLYPLLISSVILTFTRKIEALFDSMESAEIVYRAVGVEKELRPHIISRIIHSPVKCGDNDNGALLKMYCIPLIKN